MRRVSGTDPRGACSRCRPSGIPDGRGDPADHRPDACGRLIGGCPPPRLGVPRFRAIPPTGIDRPPGGGTLPRCGSPTPIAGRQPRHDGVRTAGDLCSGWRKHHRIGSDRQQPGRHRQHNRRNRQRPEPDPVEPDPVEPDPVEPEAEPRQCPWPTAPRGRVSSNTAPMPGPSLWAMRVPPWAVAMPRAMVRPIPLPPESRVRAASPR